MASELLTLDRFETKANSASCWAGLFMARLDHRAISPGSRARRGLIACAHRRATPAQHSAPGQADEAHDDDANLRYCAQDTRASVIPINRNR